MDAQTFHELASRVARLEDELGKIKAQLVEQNRRSFEAMAGSYGDRKTLEAIAREGRKIRDADRAAAHASEKGSKHSKPRRKARQAGEVG
jgi:hypothetical protein